MKAPIFSTKVRRPSVAPDIVERDRLTHLLEEGRHRPLTLISAPAGYGKSTLVSRWIAPADHPCGWLSLDKNDNDPRQFLRYLVAAIKRVCPGIHLKTESLLAYDHLPPETEVASFILNDLGQLSESVTLVLDDFHCITRPFVNDLIAALLTHSTRSLRLVLLTRKDPSLPIATLRAIGQVTEIRMSDLLFTTTEVATFINRTLDVAVDVDTAALLEMKTEGWAVGLRLVGLYLRGEKDLKARVQELSGKSGYIADYLLAEVLSRQPPEMVEYLLETSILDRFCGSLCDHLHCNAANRNCRPPEGGADQFIQWLMENHLFVIALDDEGYWFRYHHLFRDFLSGVLQKQNSADRIADLNKVAGTWFAKNDRIEEAVRHLMAGGDTDAAVRLVRQNRHVLMNTSQFTRLNCLLAVFPEDILAKNPLLITTKAFLSADIGRNHDLHAFTRKAEQLLAGLSPESDIYRECQAELLVLRGLGACVIGDANTGLAHVQEALDYLPEDGFVIRTMAVFALSVCHQMRGRTDEAAERVREALYNPFQPPNIQARLRLCLCYVYYLDANLLRVVTAAQKCLRTIGELPIPHTRAYANYFLGMALYLQNRLASAETCLLKVLEDRYAGNPTYLAHSSFILISIYLAQDRESDAAQILDQLKEHCREHDHARGVDLIEAFEVELSLRRGDIRRAIQNYRDVDYDVNEPRYFFYVPQLTHIKCLLAEGTKEGLEEAHARLIGLDEQMRQLNRVNVRIEVFALLSIYYHRQGEDTAAMAHLCTALDMAETGCWIRSFVDLGSPMATLMRQFLVHRPDHPFARQVFGAFSQGVPSGFRVNGIRKERHAIPEIHRNDLLTGRETDILFLLAEGLSNKRIAQKCSISAETVKTHLRNISKKLGTSSRIETLNKAYELGVIQRHGSPTRISASTPKGVAQPS